MVNPDSELYRQHPDWVITIHAPRTESRHQLILNMAKPEVQDYIIDKIDRLLSEITSCSSSGYEPEYQRTGLAGCAGRAARTVVRYVQGCIASGDAAPAASERGLAELLRWRRAGRPGDSTLRGSNLISDNTIPTSRLAIQAGFSQIFPAATMEAWVTDMGDVFLPLDFRFHASMCGVLASARTCVNGASRRSPRRKSGSRSTKKSARLSRRGNCTDWVSPFTDAFTGVQYVSKDQLSGVLFAFLTHRADPVPPLILYPRRLTPDRLYRIEGFAEARSGAAWMKTGVVIHLPNFGSTVRRIWCDS